MVINYFNSTNGSAAADNSNQESIDIFQQINEAERAKLEAAKRSGELLEKALSSDDPNTLIKADSMYKDIMERQKDTLKTEIWDPSNAADGYGYKYKNFYLSDRLLRRMVKTTPFINAIVSTRQAQVADFAVPQKDKYSTGFIVRKKGEYYSLDEAKVTTKDKKTIKYITDFLLNCGDERNKWDGINFDQFLRLMVSDSLTLDKACFEVGRDKGGNPYTFRHADGATIYIATTIDTDSHPEADQIKGYTPSTVQVIDGVIKAEMYPWELCMGRRNITTDIYENGYGTSEVETLLNVITDMINAQSYNGRIFSQGTNAKGIFSIKPGANRAKVAELKQQFAAQAMGLNAAHRLLMMETDEMQFIDLLKTNRDMEFGAWQEFLIKMACAVFKIAPEEMGWKVGNSSGSSDGLGQDGTKAKLQFSKDKGLKPLLTAIQFWINKWIVEPIDEKFEFVFSGIDSQDADKELESVIKSVGSFMGYREARVKMGLPPDFEEGDFPLNNVYIQKLSADMYSQQSQENTNAAESDNNDEDWHNGLGDAEKGLINELGLDATNPMMIDAIKSFDKAVRTSGKGD